MTTQDSNATRLRRLNERAVLNAIRAGGVMSKADIARATQLTPPAVSSIVRTLAGAELLEVKAMRKGGVGSPSELFGLRERGAFSLGLHIGRLAMNSVLVDFCGHIVASFEDDYDFPRFDEVSRRALEHVGRLTNTLPKHEQARIAGLGVSIPHLFAFWGDELGFPSGVSEDWKRNDITRYLSGISQFPVYSENDASAAALAELDFGVGREVHNFFHIYINTFIGGGLVLDGRLVRGPQDLAATFGPYPVSFSRLGSVTPSARNFEYLFRRASVFVLMRHVRAGGMSVRRVRELADLDARAQVLVEEWVEDAAQALAEAILGTVSIIDVEAIVLDGIMPADIRRLLTDRVRERIEDHADDVIIVPRILEGRLGASATAVGAALLPMHERYWLNERPRDIASTTPRP